MRIGVVDLSHMVRVRETFRLPWRIPVAVIFILYVLLWWWAIARPTDVRLLLTDPSLRVWTFAVAGFWALVFGAAMRRKGDLARLLFASAVAFLLLMNLFVGLACLAAAAEAQHPAATLLAGLIILLLLMYSLRSLVRHGYALLLSLVPFGRRKAYRQQVRSSLRLWSGHWRGAEEGGGDEAGAELPPPMRWAPLRLALAVLALLVGLLCMPLGLLGMMKEDLYTALLRGDFAQAWDVVLNLLPPDDPPWGRFWLNILRALVVMLFGGLFLSYFGYTWNRWQRGKIPVYRTPLARNVTPSSLLLLRSFGDDVKPVKVRQSQFSAFTYGFYQWSYTFEQLIVERLACVGTVHLFGTPDQAALPPRGGVRHQVGAAEWQGDFLKAIDVVRMIVLVLGRSNTIWWELDEIRARGLFPKTVFLLPTGLSREDRRQLLEGFIRRVYGAASGARVLPPQVAPRRVLAACFHRGDLVFITGADNELAYGSALDLATILTLAAAAPEAELIPRYLDPGAG